MLRLDPGSNHSQPYLQVFMKLLHIHHKRISKYNAISIKFVTL